MRAHEENETNMGNLRTEEFIHSINELLSPFEIQFGDYTTMEFFVRSNSETSDRALDVWKNFLWEWTTERALPFETTYKHKYFSSIRILAYLGLRLMLRIHCCLSELLYRRQIEQTLNGHLMGPFRNSARKSWKKNFILANAQCDG